MYLPTTIGPFVCHSPSPNKRKLFCLFVCRGTLPCYGVGAFSLPIPHDMHLVVPTQLCFFWVVCHPSRTLPPKEPKQESQNRFFPSPQRQTMPSYFWPMTSPCLVLVRYRLVMSGPCTCFTSVYVQNLPAAHAFALAWGLFCTFCRLSLTSYGVSYFLIPHSLWPTPFKARVCLIVGFSSFSSFFCSFLQFCISCCTILSLLLWCYLTQAC